MLVMGLICAQNTQAATVVGQLYLGMALAQGIVFWSTSVIECVWGTYVFLGWINIFLIC